MPSTLLCQEGITQGNPLAIPFYALATLPLIDSLSKDAPEVTQIWYADDANAIGRLADLKSGGIICHKLAIVWLLRQTQKSWLVTKDSICF